MSTVWKCDFRAPSGYGRAARADLRSVIKAGITPRVSISRHDVTELDLGRDKFWAKHQATVLEQKPEHPKVLVWQETPEFYRVDPTVANVARIEWETSQIVNYNHSGQPHYNWVAQLNRVREIWTSSNFVAEVLRNSGVMTPCHVIPHPVDLEAFSPGERNLIGTKGAEINRDKFTCLALFQFTTRKSPWSLLTAWCRSSLGKRDDCCLVLKTYGSAFDDRSGQDIRQKVGNFKRMLNIRGLKPNVHPVTWLVTEEDMPEMYRAADVFLHPSKGEGFGMPVSEAGACGLPAIYTNATAHTEFATGWPVKCHPTPVTDMPHIPWYSAEQDWWQIDTLDFVEKLEEAYECWKSDKLRDIGARARAKIEELHSDERCGAMLRERILALGGSA